MTGTDVVGMAEAKAQGLPGHLQSMQVSITQHREALQLIRGPALVPLPGTRSRAGACRRW